MSAGMCCASKDNRKPIETQVLEGVDFTMTN